MAQEGSEASATSTSSNPNWWDIHANLHLSSWMSPWQQQQQHHCPNSTSCNEGMPASAATSFANLTSNHSGLSGTDDSSEPVDHHLWSHLLLGVGGNAAGGGGNPAEAAMFEAPASCDYQNWSIAPPQGELDALRIEAPPDSSSTSSYVSSSGFVAPCYEDVQQQQQPGGSPQVMGGVGYHVGGLKEPFHGLGGCKYGGVVGVQDAAWPTATRNFTDLISFGSSLNKAMVVSSRPCSRGSDVAEVRKQLGHDTTSPSTRRNYVKGTGNASEGKNKRSEDSQENSLNKKPKHETSKLQLPKVKLADKITALQQIVSPFGKTDTASVLLEAINYIRFLHEQVQLLSDPYMKSGVNKDHTSWGGLERKDVAERKVDLSSRGLCLVPISCTPQVYRENTGPDYWTPTYRGCLYR